jgi:F-type H+-transporting ATPase subunit delta
MTNTRVAHRYAASLMRLAIEQNKLEEVYRDMQFMGNAVACSRELTTMFRSPVTRAESKISVVDALYAGSEDQITSTFLRLVIKKRREAVIPGMIQSFSQMYRAQKGIVKARLETAVEWSDQLTAEVCDIIAKETESKVEMSTRINPDLMAGFVIQVEDRRFERSVARSLQEIRQLFSDNPYIKKY